MTRLEWLCDEIEERRLAAILAFHRAVYAVLLCLHPETRQRMHLKVRKATLRAERACRLVLHGALAWLYDQLK